MHTKPSPDYLAGYPASMEEQVHQLIIQGTLADRLLLKYPAAHTVRTDRALYEGGFKYQLQQSMFGSSFSEFHVH